MKKVKHSIEDKVISALIGIFMVVFVVVTLYPVINTVAISFNEGIDAVRGGIYLWPRKFSLKNYDTVLAMQNLLTGAKISVARTVLGTVSSLLVNALLAYVVSRKRFLFKSQLSLFWVITMYVNGGMIPTFLLYRNLHLTNSFWVYIIPGMIGAWNMLVLRTYMNGLPDSLEESAQLDGAGYMTIFVKIISSAAVPMKFPSGHAPAATSPCFFPQGEYNRVKQGCLVTPMRGGFPYESKDKSDHAVRLL